MFSQKQTPLNLIFPEKNDLEIKGSKDSLDRKEIIKKSTKKQYLKTTVSTTTTSSEIDNKPNNVISGRFHTFDDVNKMPSIYLGQVFFQNHNFLQPLHNKSQNKIIGIFRIFI